MGYYRRVIRIQATDSPNVRLGLAQERAGQEPTSEMLVPGVLGWHDYQKRLLTWDAVKQCIGLRGEFYEGGEVLMFPPDWLNRSEQEALGLTLLGRRAKGMGIDPAEGRDNTAFAVVDDLGLLHLLSYKTPNTQDIIQRSIKLMKLWGLDPRRVCFDRGGGGYGLACQLRDMGYPVRTVGFGEPIAPVIDRKHKTLKLRRTQQEERYPYKNRRAEMYGRLRDRLDPSMNDKPFALPAQYDELRRQLAVFPLRYEEGRMVLPPKTRKSRQSKEEKSLEELIGHSPDEADALVLAMHAAATATKSVLLGRIFAPRRKPMQD